MNDSVGSASRTSHNVVFVGGSSYSGSTMLDMMLANGPDTFSCGEVGFMFKPYREHHLAARSADDPRESILWAELFATGPERLYLEIFERFPKVRTIIDSTKDPIWIHDQSRHLKHQSIEVRNVVIWKTPGEFFASRDKRGRKLGWKRAWVNYHRLYFRLVPDWASVSYSELVKHPESLRSICEQLGVEYFPGKEEYWNGEFQTIFGNASAKIHLHSQDSDTYQDLMADTPDDEVLKKSKHREIRYPDQDYSGLSKTRDATSERILNVLAARDATSPLRIDQPTTSIDKLAAGAIFEAIRRIYRTLRSAVAVVALRLLPLRRQ